MLSEEREVHCRLASMILLLFVLVCIALVLQEWQEFQVEVAGRQTLILTVDPCSSFLDIKPNRPRKFMLFRMLGDPHGFWKF